MVTIYTDKREEYEAIQKLLQDNCIFGCVHCKGEPTKDCKDCERDNFKLHCNEQW